MTTKERIILVLTVVWPSARLGIYVGIIAGLLFNFIGYAVGAHYWSWTLFFCSVLFGALVVTSPTIWQLIAWFTRSEEEIEQLRKEHEGAVRFLKAIIGHEEPTDKQPSVDRPEGKLIITDPNRTLH